MFRKSLEDYADKTDYDGFNSHEFSPDGDVVIRGECLGETRRILEGEENLGGGLLEKRLPKGLDSFW